MARSDLVYLKLVLKLSYYFGARGERQEAGALSLVSLEAKGERLEAKGSVSILSYFSAAKLHIFFDISNFEAIFLIYIHYTSAKPTFNDLTRHSIVHAFNR